MPGKLKKLSCLIINEFQEHVDQIAKVVKDEKDFDNAIQEAIEMRIGQIHNMDIWGELAELYAEMLHKKLDGQIKKHYVAVPGKGTYHADDVRQYCKDNIVATARRSGNKQVAIRAGDIHTAMGYQSRMPLVCAALGARKFEELAGIERISLTGPSNGANAVFTFKIK